MSKRLVFFGNERLVSGLPHSDTPVLRGLLERGYEIVAIVANYETGTSRSARKLEVAEVAKEHNIPLFTPEKPADIFDELRKFHADAAVLVAYGRIIPQRVIDVFGPVGIINIHPSLLPRHRGPTPIESTILAGDTEAGVSIMRITAGMDEGPVYTQARVPLSGSETKFELYEKLSELGAKLLIDSLPDILENKLQPVSQQNDGVTVTSLILKQHGILDTTTDTAYALERKIRAHLSYPKSRLSIGNNDVVVTMAKVVDGPGSGILVVPCAEKTYLEILELTAPSGKKMTGEAYLRGYAA